MHKKSKVLFLSFLISYLAKRTHEKPPEYIKCKDRDDPKTPALAVHFDFSPHWLIYGRRSHARCSACLAEGEVLVWALEKQRTLSIWTVSRDNNNNNNNQSTTSGVFTAGVTASRDDAVLEPDAEELRSRLDMNVTDALENGLLQCFSLDAKKAGEIESLYSPAYRVASRSMPAILLRVYYPPQKPVLRVFYHRPPAVVANRHELRAVCSAYVGSEPGTMSWRLETLRWAERDWSSTHITTQPSVWNSEHGLFINSSFTSLVDYTMQGANLTCTTYAHPGYKTATNSHHMHLTSSSLPFSVYFSPQKPILQVQRTGTNYWRAVCSAYVGTGGYLSWVVWGRLNMTSWIVNTKGHIEVINKTDHNVPVKVSASKGLTDDVHGPRIASSLEVEKESSAFSSSDRIACYSYKTANRTDLLEEAKLVSVLRSADLQLDEDAAMVSPFILGLAGAFAILFLFIGTIYSLRPSQANTNLNENNSDE